jgi:DNA modification methylase
MWYMEGRQMPTRTKQVNGTVNGNGNGHKNGRKAVNDLNDLTAKEWISETVSVWTQRGLGQNHQEAQIEKLHPAPFSYQDVARLIRFFSKVGDTVLDPFAGVGSTLKAAALENRRGIGIELQPEFASLARRRLKVEVPKEPSVCQEQKVITGDAFSVLPTLEPESVKLIVTSPPYWNILHKQDHKAKQERTSKGLAHKYSDSDQDLGNIADYGKFIAKLSEAFTLCAPILKPGGHMCIVVGDFREKSRYHMLHADLANSLEQRGFVLKGITILYQRHKRIYPYGYPYSYVPNLHHQYILILKKP